MRALRSTLLVVAVAALAPATASADALSFTDACGDAQDVVRVQGSSLGVATHRTSRHDIRRTTIDDLPAGGLLIRVEVCGAIPAPETLASSWGVGATMPDGCGMQLDVEDPPGVDAPRSAHFSKVCSVPDPRLPGFTTTQTVFEIPLPVTAYVVSGSTVSWTLARGEYGDAAAEALASGTVLSMISSFSRDGGRVTEAGHGDSGVAANGPGAHDVSGTSATFTVR